MRWSTVLNQASVVAKRWRGPLSPQTHEDSVVLRLGPDAEGRRAAIAVEAGAEGIQVAALAEGRGGGTRPPHPEWYYRDHLVAFLNPGHDHATRWMCAVDDAGEALREATWIAPGEEPGDHPSRALAEPPAAEGDFRRLGEGRFWARVFLPGSEALWRGATPLGLRVKVGFHEEVVPRPLAWPDQPAWMEDLPLSYGDLFAGEPVVAVKAVEFPEPSWGGEASRVVLRMAVAPGGPREGRVDIAAILPEDSEQAQPSVAWAASASGVADVSLPVVFPHRAKWASDVRLTAALRLTVRDRGGAALWSGQYPFGFDCGVIVRERYGPRGARLPERPAASAHDFIGRHRAYILARLPDYRRRTTREGAPSDFTLEDATGGEHLDLMAPDALGRVAALLAQRFGDWQDALAAAALWAYHPCVTRHSATWAPVANQAAVGAVPRLGGCFCADVARLVAALADEIGERLGVPLRGYTLGLRGHLATLVETPLGRVVLDGMLGHWYPTLDNARLATLDEMRASAEIVQRLWYCPRAHGHEFYFGIHDQIIQRWREKPLRFPSAT
ncbi:MAG TPA: hypothetical protein VNE39_28080 [Planctomycetota bacterium]|nr:hypothetical protein [Planctomycetota bacterium]